MDSITIKEAEKIQMDTAFSELRKNFASNNTRSYEWRKETLQHLRKVIKESEPNILDALQKDLNMGTFNAYLSGIGVSLMLIDHTLDNLKRW